MSWQTLIGTPTKNVIYYFRRFVKNVSQKEKRRVRKCRDWIQIRCKWCYCNLSRTASVSATAAVRTIVEEEVNSSASEEETYEANEIVENSEPEESVQGKGRKRGATRGRGRGSTPAKRGRKAESSFAHNLFMHRDQDEDDDDVSASNRMKKAPPQPQPRAPRNYGSIKRR